MQANPLRLDFTVSRRTPARRISATLERLIASFPSLVEQERICPAATTEITGFLENQARTLDCSGRDTVFVLLTDGTEASQRTDPGALTAGDAELPEPPGQILAGCRISMMGIGETVKGADPSTTRALIAAWQSWAELAGAEFEPRPAF